MVPLAPPGLTRLAVAGRGLSDGLGLPPQRTQCARCIRAGASSVVPGAWRALPQSQPFEPQQCRRSKKLGSRSVRMWTHRGKRLKRRNAC